MIVATLSALALATSTSGTEAGMRVAQATWGTPACGHPHVEAVTPAQYMRERSGTWIKGQPEAWADENLCVIAINPNWKIYTAAKRCHVIVHEWGHLAGFSDPSNVKDPLHSSNPRSVMYATDLVNEGTIFSKMGKGTVWVSSGAFKSCYAATRSK